MSALDTRIPHGVSCAWWDSIDKVGKTVPLSGGHRLPCCPHCGGMLFEVPNEASWFEGVDHYEAAGHPGYRTMVEWGRGKCFPSYSELTAAYAERDA